MQNACDACTLLSFVAMANVQIRGVPDDVHRQLKSQAALSGQSLNEFLLARLSEFPSLPPGSASGGCTPGLRAPPSSVRIATGVDRRRRLGADRLPAWPPARTR